MPSPIEKLIAEAKKNKISKKGQWQIMNVAGRWDLRHYGMLLLTVKSGKPTYVGGHSVSDARGIQSMLNSGTITRYGYKVSRAKTKAKIKHLVWHYGKPIIKNGDMRIYHARRIR